MKSVLCVCTAPFGMLVDILLDLDFNLNDFCSKSDEELAAIAKNNRSAAEALIYRYSKLVSIKSKIYANSNTESDDLHQEGLISIFKAISAFDLARGVKFSTFSEVCIVNRMRTLALEAGRRQPVNDIDSLDETELISVEETPESIYLYKEFIYELRTKIRSVLSPSELRVFELCVRGSSYRRIAEILGINEKAVDNAMQRARRKLRTLLHDSN